MSCSKKAEPLTIEAPFYSKIELSGDGSGTLINLKHFELNVIEQAIESLFKNNDQVKLVLSKEQKLREGIYTESHTFYISFNRENKVYTLLMGEGRIGQYHQINPLIKKIEQKEKDLYSQKVPLE